VSTRAVTLGPNTADTVAVEKGLEAGEMVVVDGADKLRQGAKIELPTAAAGQAENAGAKNGETGTPGRRQGGKRPPGP